MSGIFRALVVLGCAVVVTADAANSGSITIQGTLMKSSGLRINPLPGYNSLSILDGANNQAVATVTETSNGENGYIVTLQSVNANASKSSQPTLNGTGANTDRVPYSITYSNAPVQLDNTGTATVTSTTTRTSRGGVTKSLNVTINPTWVTADTYSDTLILTLRHNN